MTMAENIATLGFEFKIDGAESAIAKIVQRLDDLDEQSKRVMFGMELMSSYTVDSLVKITKALQALPKIDNSVLSSIGSLSNSFRDLSTVSIGLDVNIRKIFEVMGSLPTVSDKAVTQFGAIANAMAEIKKPMSEENLSLFSAFFNTLKSIKPVPTAVVTNLNALAVGLNKAKLSEETARTFDDIVYLMKQLKPISPVVAQSITDFVISINKIENINTSLPMGIADFFNSFGNFNISDNIATQISQMGEALTKLKTIKPETTVAVRELLNVFSNTKAVDTDISASIDLLSISLIKLKAINPKITVSIRDLLETLSEMKSLSLDVIASVELFAIATTKFKVINPKITKSVKDLLKALIAFPQLDDKKIELLSAIGKATSQFKVINPKISQSVKELFRVLARAKEIPLHISEGVRRMGEAVNGFKAITPRVTENVEKIFTLISNLKPIPADVLHSITSLKDLFVAMTGASNVARNSTSSLNRSVYSLSGRADGATLAIRALQGALSANFFVKAINSSLDFAKQLAYIKSIAMELSVVKIGTGLMNFSSMLGNISENANALYYAYSSGIRGTEEDFLKFTEIASKTAQVNRASLIPMIDAMTAAMNAYKMNVTEAVEVADNFFAIVKYGKASGEQLANAYGQVSPTAKTLGLTLNELGASIASLTKIQPTRVAITGLNNMLSKIMKPTKESQLAMKKLGVDISYTAVQERGFINVMRELHTALNGNRELIKNIFPDIRGQRAAMHLLGAGWADWNTQLDNFANKKGSMEEAFAVLERDPAVQLGKIPETLKRITAEAGIMATDILTLGGSLTPLVRGFNSMSAGLRKFIAGLLLTGSSLAVFKGAVLTITTYQALMIRNKAILAAAHAKDTKNSVAEAVAIRANAQATYNSAVADTVKARTTVKKISVMIASVKATEAEAIAIAADAKLQGNYTRYIQAVNAQKVAHNALLAQENALLTAKNALMKAEEKELTALIALEKVRTTQKNVATTSNVANTASQIGNTASAVTNMGIFALLSTKLKALWGSMKAGVLGSKGLMLVITKIGSAFKWLGTLIATAWTKLIGVFSVANTIVASIVAVVAVGIDYLQSYIRTGTVANSVTHMLAEGIWDFFSGASKSLRQAEENHAKMIEILNFKKEFAVIAKNNREAINHLFDHWGEDKLPLNKLESGRKAYNKALEDYNINFRDQLVTFEKDVLAKQKKMFDIGKTSGLDSKEYSKAKAEFDESKAKYEKLSQDAETVRNQIQMGGEKMYEVFNAQIEAIKSINDIIRNQDFKSMSSVQKYAELKKMFNDNLEGFNYNREKGDQVTAQAFFAKLADNYGQIQDYVKQQIESNNRLNEEYDKLRLDSFLITAKDDNNRIELYKEQFHRFMSLSKDKADEGDFTGSTADFKKALDTQKQMLSLRNKLAQAEENANKRTLDLIKSMDKMNATAVQGIDVNSGETTKMLSREFSKGSVAFKPKTEERDKAEQLQLDIANNMLIFSNRMGELANETNKTLKTEYDRIRDIWTTNARNTERNASDLKKQLQTMISILQKLGNIKPTSLSVQTIN